MAATADRVCTHCGGIAVANDLHIIRESPVLQTTCCSVYLGHRLLYIPKNIAPDHMQVWLDPGVTGVTIILSS